MARSPRLLRLLVVPCTLVAVAAPPTLLALLAVVDLAVVASGAGTVVVAAVVMAVASDLAPMAAQIRARSGSAVARPVLVPEAYVLVVIGHSLLPAWLTLEVARAPLVPQCWAAVAVLRPLVAWLATVVISFRGASA